MKQLAEFLNEKGPSVFNNIELDQSDRKKLRAEIKKIKKSIELFKGMFKMLAKQNKKDPLKSIASIEKELKFLAGE